MIGSKNGIVILRLVEIDRIKVLENKKAKPNSPFDFICEQIKLNEHKCNDST